MAEVKETKAQRMERLKREKNPWEALDEVRKHPEVTGIEVVKLPPAGAPLPWLVGG